MPSSRTLGRTQRPNNGELNSAHGEGTTIPQLLFTIRIVTFLHVIGVFLFEGFAIVGHVLMLNARRILISFYLLFFVALLICFELVRGRPTVSNTVTGTSIGGSNRMNMSSMHMSGMSMNASNGDILHSEETDHLKNIDEGIAVASEAVNSAVETVWETVIEQRYARRLRYFLQSNFGILYTCLGRGFYLIFVGGLATGEGFILMRLVGLSFMIFGFWMLILGVRYPALDKVFVMDSSLEDEFGENKNDDEENGTVTWTSITGSMNASETRGLIAHANR